MTRTIKIYGGGEGEWGREREGEEEGRESKFIGQLSRKASGIGTWIE